MRMSASWCWDPNKPHFTILDDLVSEVLPDVNVLDALPSTDDVVSPLDACCVVLVHWCRRLLGEAELVKGLAEV